MVDNTVARTATLDGDEHASEADPIRERDDAVDLTSAERQTIDIPTAARLLGCSRGLAYQMARDGRLPVIQLSARRVVVPLPALRRMLAGEPLVEETEDGE